MIGKTQGHYRVGEPLGRGGMGEVYLADDFSLSRKVALKFLPDAFAGDPERMARFEREAKLLASLNHPNIAAIYGLEQAEGKRFLVLELVEGETLAQRLSQAPLSVEDALAVCRQIAEGLEAAHEKGVIHRDLKPANVMITAEDKIKILDFGLAKALSDETQSIDSSQSPTLTVAMTRPGVILGTAAYMSPEQAKGKSVDKRADIWAFGCILYECLTGKRVFEGETVTETLAAVLTTEPEWEKAPANVHPLLRHCLEKDPKKRLRDIGDAMPLLEGLPESIPAKQARPWLPWSIAAALLLAFSFLAFVHFLLYGSSDAKTKNDIWLLPLEGGGKERPFLRTEFNEFDARFSPDMRWVAYVSDETGSDEIYVSAFSRVSGEASPEAGGRWQVADIQRGWNGTARRGDGKELYYRAPDGKVMAVEINTDAVFSTGVPKSLFQAPPEILQSSATGLYRNWDVASDGKRFLLSIPVAENSPSPFTVILNWTALLKK